MGKNEPPKMISRVVLDTGGCRNVAIADAVVAKSAARHGAGDRMGAPALRASGQG